MEYLLKASVLITIFYICYKTFLQKETFFESNRWFLLLGLITAFCVPFIVIPVYIEQASLSISEFIFTGGSTSSNTNSNTINITQILSLVYFIGLIFFVSFLAH